MSNLAETIAEISTGLETFKAEQRKTLDLMETRLSRPGAFTGTAPDAGTGAPRIAAPTREERTAFGQLLRTGDKRFAMEAKAVINAGTSGQGLEAVAAWFDDIVLSMARDASPILKIVRTRRVANFPAKHVVTNSRVMGSGWVGEQTARSGTDAPLPQVVEVQPGEFYALPSVTEWALSDLSFDVASWLQSELVMEYSESLQAAVVSGNGTNKPKGFLAGPTPVTTADAARAFGTLQYYPTGQAATLPTTASGVLDLLNDVVHGLRWTHRQKASWVMNAQTANTLRKLKDVDGRPLLVPSYIVGAPAMLMGYPLYEVEVMPEIGAGAFPIAFGDFNAGYVLDEENNGLRITRDDITQKGFVLYYARRRVGGSILDSEALKLVKVSAT